MQILELTLLAPDIGAIRAFYAGELGLTVARESTTGVTLEAGMTQLTFERAGPGVRPSYHFAFNIDASRFDDAVRWISERAPVLGDDTRSTFHFASWNADAVYFEDPAGNIVELIARHGLRETGDHPAAPAAAFGPGRILSVSEIGLPVAAVERTARYLSTETGTRVWGDASPGFTALGDDDGLFILVASSRGWFPVGRPAEVHPVRLTIEGRRERRIDIPGCPYVVVMRPAP